MNWIQFAILWVAAAIYTFVKLINIYPPPPVAKIWVFLFNLVWWPAFLAAIQCKEKEG